MKNFLLLLSLLLIGHSLKAQDASIGIPLSVGYLGHFAIQPGVKVATRFNLKEWQTEHVSKQINFTKAKSIFVSPQIGFYTWPGQNNNLLLSADLGYRRLKVERNAYSAFSIGLGYLNISELISVVRNLNDGSIQEKKRRQEGYFIF